MKSVIKFAVLLLAAHALFRFVPPYWDHTRFVRELEESSIGWREYSDAEVRELVLVMAQSHGLPIDREQIGVTREREHLFIDLAYSRPLELVPGSKYIWEFDSQVDTWMLTPQVRSR